MTKYNVHIYREVKLRFDGIEAESPQQAAAKARLCTLERADDFAECDGEDHAALVDTVGDEGFGQSVTILFEGERLRKAATKLLEALVLARAEMLRLHDGCYPLPYSKGRTEMKVVDAAIAAVIGKER